MSSLLEPKAFASIRSGQEWLAPYLVKKRVMLAGDVLSDARVSIGQFNEPYVSVTFDAKGAREFDRITGENVKKRMAIVLDNTIYSAPVIQERISGGRAQITGTFSMEEANNLSIVLRAGALPAPLKIIQDLTVGPSLGQDSIEKGVKATLFAGLLVIMFMALYYRLSGVIANFALLLNLICLIGALAGLNATLTLPGIAGIILTIEYKRNGKKIVLVDCGCKNNIIKAFRMFNVYDSEKISIVNNTFVSSLLYKAPSGYGIELKNCRFAKVVNNIFYDVGRHEYPYLWYDINDGLEVGHNNHYISDGYQPKKTAFLPRPTDLWQTDPKFIDITDNNYHLRADSPLIDAGQSLEEVTNDFEGISRPKNRNFDIGAFELFRWYNTYSHQEPYIHSD